MNRRTLSKVFRQLRRLYNVMMGIAYLAVAYLFILIALNSESLHNSTQTIILIGLCGMGQISHYYDAYQNVQKDIFYYIGTVPPAIALTCIIFAVAKICLF